MQTVLVINPGSSSRKYALYKDGVCAFEYAFEKTAVGYEVCRRHQGEQQSCEASSFEGFSSSLLRIADVTQKYLKAEKCTLKAVAVRIVAPGTDFQTHTVIDDIYISKLRSKATAVPLHVPVVLEEIAKAGELFPDTPLIAVSDSAFHTTMPKKASEYSLPVADAEAYDIHRFGCHGMSVASVVNRVHSVIGRDPKRLIVCHIGGGVSVTAVKEGKSVDTTVGYGVVSGIPMGSRASDLDPSALLELMRMRNLRPDDALVYVHKNGGLAGLGGDADLRRLFDKKVRGDAQAKLAIEHFVYSLQKAIAAGSVALGGIDAIVLTGTAAVRSAELRERICDGLVHFGIGLDEDRNDLLVGKEGVISQQRSMIKVVVMKTDEMGEMARAASDVKK